jgi:hypothetical protein
MIRCQQKSKIPGLLACARFYLTHRLPPLPFTSLMTWLYSLQPGVKHADFAKQHSLSPLPGGLHQTQRRPSSALKGT